MTGLSEKQKEEQTAWERRSRIRMNEEVKLGWLHGLGIEWIFGAFGILLREDIYIYFDFLEEY